MRIITAAFLVSLLFLAACGGQTYSTKAVEPTPSDTATVRGAPPAATAQPTPGTPSCTDGDGGIDKVKKATLVSIDESGKSVTYDDLCIRPDLLLENYCEDGVAKNQKMKCDKAACSDGSCV